MKRVVVSVVIGALAATWTAAEANPIPVPVPASMPLEEMRVSIAPSGQVRFSGDFTFDFIPADVGKMQFPLPPVNAAGVRVLQDGVPLAWALSADTYPTVLPEYPELAMFEWAGPFPEAGAVFTVEYEHQLFRRGGERVFFYSLGTGKYLPTYDKITTAILEIDLPGSDVLRGVLLDDAVLDPSYSTLTGSRLEIVLESEYGPFTRDLILLLVPEPGSLGLVFLGALAWGVVRAGGRGWLRPRRRTRLG